MSSLNVTNLKSSKIGTTHAECCNSVTKNQQMDRISVFFERHATTRKIVAYLPTVVLGGAAFIEKVSSHKLLPDIGILSAVALMTIGCFSGWALSCETSLKENKIERLN